MFPLGDPMGSDSLSWFLDSGLDEELTALQQVEEPVSSTQEHGQTVTRRRARRHRRDASDMGRKRRLVSDDDCLAPSKLDRSSVSSSVPESLAMKLEAVEEESDSSKARFIRSNHSEIEKRRRDKMNTYISELAAIIPSCSAMARKMDKLTVLRLALQYLRSIKGASSGSMTEINVRPALLAKSHLSQLIERISEGFLFIIDLARGRLLHIAENVADSLSYSRGELLGKPLFDLIHPKDIAHVKEQLPDNRVDEPKERLVDAKTGIALKTGDNNLGLNANLITAMSPGARRAFLCRMKIKVKDELFSEEGSTHSSISGTGSVGKRSVGRSQRKYALMQCIGYIKTLPSNHVTEAYCNRGDEKNERQDRDDDVTCLVAVARPIISPSTSLALSVKKGHEAVRGCDFNCRLSIAAKFMFLEDRSAAVLGYMPRELLGSCIYSHVHSEDVSSLSDTLTKANGESGKFESMVFRFRNKNHSYVCLRISAKQFVNPWTQETDFLACRFTMCVPIHLRDPSKHLTAPQLVSRAEVNLNPSSSSSTIQTTAKVQSDPHRVTDVSRDHQTSQKQDQRSSLCVGSRNNLLPSLFKDERRTNVGLAPRMDLSSQSSSSSSSTSAMPNMKQEQSKLADNSNCSNPSVVSGIPGLNEGDDTSMSLIMSLLEVDGGMGADLGSTWPLP